MGRVNIKLDAWMHGIYLLIIITYVFAKNAIFVVLLFKTFCFLFKAC